MLYTNYNNNCTVCVSVCQCVCVLCLMRFQQKTLWTRAKLFICRNCWECVCEWVCVWECVLVCACVCGGASNTICCSLTLSFSLASLWH